MRKNRTLVIILLAGVTVALVFGIGLALFYPRQDSGVLEILGEGVDSAQSFDPIQYLRDGASPVPDLLPVIDSVAEGLSGRAGDLGAAIPGDLVIVYDGSALAGPSDAAQRAIDDAPRGTMGPTQPRSRVAVTTVQIEAENEPERVEPTEPRPTRPTQSTRQAAPARPTGAASSTVPARPTGAASSTASARPTETATAISTPVSYSSQRYWIQIISTTNRDRVDQLRTTIAGHSINARLETTEQNNRRHYRLRYGPFGNRDEAQKFLEWMRAIDRLDDIYITQ